MTPNLPMKSLRSTLKEVQETSIQVMRSSSRFYGSTKREQTFYSPTEQPEATD